MEGFVQVIGLKFIIMGKYDKRICGIGIGIREQEVEVCIWDFLYFIRLESIKIYVERGWV